jgi:hypothetical protein
MRMERSLSTGMCCNEFRSNQPIAIPCSDRVRVSPSSSLRANARGQLRLPRHGYGYLASIRTFVPGGADGDLAAALGPVLSPVRAGPAVRGCIVPFSRNRVQSAATLLRLITVRTRFFRPGPRSQQSDAIPDSRQRGTCSTSASSTASERSGERAMRARIARLGMPDACSISSLNRRGRASSTRERTLERKAHGCRGRVRCAKRLPRVAVDVFVDYPLGEGAVTVQIATSHRRRRHVRDASEAERGAARARLLSS